MVPQGGDNFLKVTHKVGEVWGLHSQSCRPVIVLVGGTNFVTSYCSTVGTFDQNRPRTLTIAECLQHRKHKGLFTCMGLTVTSKKKETRSRKSWSKLRKSQSPTRYRRTFYKRFHFIGMGWPEQPDKKKNPLYKWLFLYISIYFYI